MRYDLRTFSLSDMIRCSATLREIGVGATSLEDVAQRIVRFFHRSFVDPTTGESQFALVRFYKTHPCSDLEPPLLEFAQEILGKPVEAGTRCLTLIASAGDEPEWNSRHRSDRHRAIPLPSVDIVERFPMITQLIRQFGLDVGDLLTADQSLFIELDQRSYNVFHVENAEGHPHVPAQEFVQTYGIRSVLGFGGMLPTGDLFAGIVFSRVHIDRATADLFKVLALAVKVPTLNFVHGPLFEPATDTENSPAKIRHDD
ncbi:MAG TPA: hypothetical protein VM600_04135 [Actinomycetota bacterium]|nr:hypothetical protein [Actinomycetota bacterium]